MKNLFVTLENANGDVATVRGKNEHGEYVVTFNKTTYYPNRMVTRIDGTYYTNDLEDACHTAIHGNFRQQPTMETDNV